MSNVLLRLKSRRVKVSTLLQKKCLLLSLPIFHEFIIEQYNTGQLKKLYTLNLYRHPQYLQIGMQGINLWVQ